jgi:Domain of unknown function (DUF4384)
LGHSIAVSCWALRVAPFVPRDYLLFTRADQSRFDKQPKRANLEGLDSMNIFRTLPVAALLLIFAASLSAQTSLAPETGAKELFMGVDGKVTQIGTAPARVAAKPKVLGIQTTIYQLFGDGGTKAVSPNNVFRGGDRIRLGFNVNRPGYLYLINIGTSGKVTTLFPTTANDNNFVHPGLVYQVPQQTGKSIRFDNVPGQETLLVVLSESKLTQIEFSGQMLSIAPQTSVTNTAKVDLPINITMADASGSKDLVLSDDGPFITAAFAPGSDSANTSRPLSIVVKLIHK